MLQVPSVYLASCWKVTIQPDELLKMGIKTMMRMCTMYKVSKIKWN